MLLAACCLTLTGCARKETGSELLTETKDAVVPVDGKVDPVVEKTPEGTAFHLYYGDENAENIVQKTVYVDKVTEDSVMEQLAQALYDHIPVGVGSKGIIPVNNTNLVDAMVWLISPHGP